MAEIRALVADDEPLARRGIRQLLAAYPDVVVAGESRDGPETLRALAAIKPDLLFLDIQMPGLDGMSALRLHGIERVPATVFVTAHDQFAVQAFEAQALDYLVKPLSEARFRKAMARVLERLRVRPATRIAVRTAAGELLLDSSEVDWIGADGDHARLHVGGREYRVRETLTALHARLGKARFARVHRAAIVRLDQVRELVPASGGAALLRLRDGTELEVSRRRIAALRTQLEAPPAPTKSRNPKSS